MSKPKTVKLVALTLRQPFAQATVLGLKTQEFRSRSTTHRGVLAIHAGLKVERAGRRRVPDRRRRGPGRVVGCEEDGDGWAWALANPVALGQPFPCEGQFGQWHLDIPLALLPAGGTAGLAC